MKRLKAWWRANVIAMDPHPEYSALDQRDGLYPSGLITDQAAADELAERMYGGRK